MSFKRTFIILIILLLPSCTAAVRTETVRPYFKPLNENSGARIVQKVCSVPIKNVKSALSRQFVITKMPYAGQMPKRAVNVHFNFSASKSMHYTVYFKLNSSWVAPAEVLKLKKIILSLQHKQVSVVGYTCWFGSQQYNQRLALKRAKTVAVILKKFGLDVIVITGKGKCCYANRKNPSLDRRVEISVLKGGGDKRG